ncbi:MAG: hypothetical protein HZA89_07365 [Verrucomicrobia bacterium]|nr:hypothetical protein [Verrucomicrobiota bacterium]
MIKLKQFGWLMGLCLAATAARGATMILTNINAPLVNPSFNAVSVVNNSTVTASNTTFTFELFKLQNALNLTNKVSGRFIGYPGYDFSTITNSIRLPLANFVNQGTINATSGIVDIFATNLASPGNITVAADGVARLKGFDVNLSRGTIQAGSGAAQSPGFNDILNRQYQNPGLIQDIYWGTGTNQRITGRFVFEQDSDAYLPENMYYSPLHEVIDRRAGGRTFVQLTNSGLNPFAVYVYQRRTQSTNFHYYVVYLATNSVDTNVFADVRFSDFNSGDDTEVFVEIRTTPDTDVITGAPIDNRLYFVDRLGPQGNSVLSTGYVLDGGFLTPSGASRPRSMEIMRTTGTPFEFFSGSPSNATLGVFPRNPVDPLAFGTYDIKAISGNPDQTIFNFIGPFAPGGSNEFVVNAYAAYGAEIGSSVFGTQLHPGSPGLSDPTNAVGRIEIEGQNVDLSLARMRGENLLSIRCTNSISVSNAVLDAPNVNLYLTNTTRPALTLTNILASGVKRFNGQVFAWSADWFNEYLLSRPAGGNSNATAFFHVLVLDISKVGISQDVVTDRLVVNSTNVIMNNTLRPGRSFVIDAHAVTFESNNVLNLFSSAVDMGATNLPNVRHFTNHGVVSVAGLAKFGSDREEPFTNVVNTGSLLAAGGSVRSRYFQNTGSFIANGGALDITADDADIQGTFSSASDILLAGSNLVLNGHVASAAGALNLIVTNSLSDSGVPGTNVINCGYGFSLPLKPARGDLLGTVITSTVPAFASISHLWAGEDRGATAAGFTNNTALGKLAVSCAGNFSLAAFTGAGTSNALYVDRLELLGSAETNFANVLSIDPNIVLYFASANVPPESLDGQFGGRLRWVRSYLGPNSSSNVVLASGQTITVNSSLLASTAIDSDGDGTSNGADASPFDGVAIDSRVTFIGDPPTAAQISWNAAAQTTYRVEFTTALSSAPVWELLTTLTHSAATNAVVTVSDTNLGGTQRYYRVSYTPQ